MTVRFAPRPPFDAGHLLGFLAAPRGARRRRVEGSDVPA